MTNQSNQFLFYSRKPLTYYKLIIGETAFTTYQLLVVTINKGTIVLLTQNMVDNGILNFAVSNLSMDVSQKLRSPWWVSLYVISILIHFQSGLSKDIVFYFKSTIIHFQSLLRGFRPKLFTRILCYCSKIFLAVRILS